MSFLTRFKEGYRVGELETSLHPTYCVSSEKGANGLSAALEKARELPIPRGFFEKLGYHLGHYINSLPSEFY